MARNLFSIPILFVVFRESLETSIVIAVLLGLVEQIVRTGGAVTDPETPPESAPDTAGGEKTAPISDSPPTSDDTTSETVRNRTLVKKLRWQIFLGGVSGLLVAFVIGAAFLAVWFTKASNLWAKSEAPWEGAFSLLASIIIFVMGITMLKMDRAKAKWKVKLQHAFEGKDIDSSTLTSRFALFILPFVTVLREGMEAVIFVGGVSLGQPATSIPIAAIVGIICGMIVGYIIYAFASRTTLSVFLVVMTNFLLLIGAGLFSKSVGFFEATAFIRLLGTEVDDSGGDGPGSYPVPGNVWHINCCNPENHSDGGGWNIFAALFGWTNSASIGTVLAYVFYWIAVVVTLVLLKWREGRTTLFGHESIAGQERRLKRERKAEAQAGTDVVAAANGLSRAELH